VSVLESGSHQAGQAVTAGIAAGAYTGLVLYNPLTSPVRLRMRHAIVVPTVAPASVAALMLAVGFQAAGAPTLSGGISSVIRTVKPGGVAAIGQLYTTMTIPTAGGNDRQTVYNRPLGFVGTSLPALVVATDASLDQVPSIDPGGWIMIASTVAMTIIGGFVWETEGA
jgi:hypothetical protein